MAIDSTALVDSEPGVINRAALERLGRKTTGIDAAWDKVCCEADWSKPAGAKGGWKPRVDYEAGRC
eukprot:11202044-Lingulodinium_polyedra.AAC.1